MRGDHAFGVVQALHFQQHIAAAGDIGRIGHMQHQALAATLDDGGEFCIQSAPGRHAYLLNRLQLRPSGVAYHFNHARIALGERARSFGQLENQVRDFAPFVIHRLRLAHDAGEFIEPAAREPEFAVKRCGRQLGGEPRRRGHIASAAKAQYLAVPHCAHAVEFFAHQIAADIDARVIFVRQQQRQGGGSGGRLRVDQRMRTGSEKCARNEEMP